jgi:nascent polypeptide-associated complex subunit alpha
MNPKQMKKMMRQMGMEMKELPAKEVIIKLENNEINITDPTVNVIEMQGQKTYQITGGAETTVEGSGGVSEEDVNLVASQAGVSKGTARKALENTKGDIAEAIMSLAK